MLVLSQSDLPCLNHLGVYSTSFQWIWLTICLSDERCLEISDLPVHLTVIKLQEDEQVECHFCNVSTKLKDMRNYVGKHILCAFRGVEDPSLKASISVNLCGWCGRQGCKIQLIKKGTSNFISSSCPYHYSKMMYGRAAQYSKSSSCTTVPIHCPLCLEGLSGT